MLLNLPAVLHFPFFDEETGEQRFPFRSFLMLASIVIQLVVSLVARAIFSCGCLSLRYDYFKCFTSSDVKVVAVMSENQQDSDKPGEEACCFLNNSEPKLVTPGGLHLNSR